MLKMTMYDCNCVSHDILVFYGCILVLHVTCIMFQWPHQTNINYLQFKHIDVPIVQTYLLEITTHV